MTLCDVVRANVGVLVAGRVLKLRRRAWVYPTGAEVHVAGESLMFHPPHGGPPRTYSADTSDLLADDWELLP